MTEYSSEKGLCFIMFILSLSLSLSFLYISILSILTGGKRVLYNLYGVSNHSGGVHSGHYTANCKHPYSGEWNVFNDTRYAAIFFYTIHMLPFMELKSNHQNWKMIFFFKSAKTKKSMDKIFVLFKSAFVCYIYCKIRVTYFKV